MPTSGSSSLNGKHVLVMGLGRFGGGVGVAKWLVAQGAHVTITDAAKADELADSVKALDGLPIHFKLGGHDISDFLNSDLLIINPAVDKEKSEPVQAALKRPGGGVPYTTEMNLFLERCPARTIGITGSVGKSTTTMLIYEALKAAFGQVGDHPQQEGPRVFLGGNIGRSLLLDLPAIRPQDFVVLELSSFMLEETPRIGGAGSEGGGWGWSPQIAVVTNIFPNHLDRHRTMAAYTAAKQNILRFQKLDDLAILNNDHDLVSRWVHLAMGKVMKFTTRGPALKNVQLVMPGPHNLSNAAAAIALVDALSLPNRPAALNAIEHFPGLPHRLQCVHTWQITGAAGLSPRQVRFYNDSKATTPDASITALEAFPPRTAILIVGGYDKHIDLSAFEGLLAQRAAGVIGIGQTGQAIIDHVRSLNSQVPSEHAVVLEAAVSLAKKWAAQTNQVEAVVLSPASASWDQFPNYEKRGELFATLSQGH